MFYVLLVHSLSPFGYVDNWACIQQNKCCSNQRNVCCEEEGCLDMRQLMTKVFKQHKAEPYSKFPSIKHILQLFSSLKVTSEKQIVMK